MNGNSYLEDTGFAIKHMFDGLEECDSKSVSANTYFLQHWDRRTGQIQMNKTEANELMERALASISLDTARAVLAGSIIQVAYVGIDTFSNKLITKEQIMSFGFTQEKMDRKKLDKLSRFFIGREVHGIPIGLLIYAARVQYNHSGERHFTNEATKLVFSKLVWKYHDDPMSDLIYEQIKERPLSHYIVRQELRWKNYDDYLCDMKALIGKPN
jgi:hypothetical protein